MGRIEYWLLGAVGALIAFIAFESVKSGMEPRRYALQVEQAGTPRGDAFGSGATEGDTIPWTVTATNDRRVEGTEDLSASLATPFTSNASVNSLAAPAKLLSMRTPSSSKRLVTNSFATRFMPS